MLTFRPRTARVANPVIFERPLRQSARVLATADAEEMVLLDLRSGRYFTLNEVGSRVWMLLAKATTPRAIVEMIRGEYDSPTPALDMAIEQDVAQLLARLLGARLITGAPVQEPPLEAPSVWTCAALLCAVRVGLKVAGLDRTRRALGFRVRRCRNDSPDPRLIRDCVRSVALAAAFFPGRALCLERSLTLWHVLACRGVPVELCLGVQRFPFAAHAWVSCLGEPLNDVREHVEHFQPLTELAS
jgi:hypothetical protein